MNTAPVNAMIMALFAGISFGLVPPARGESLTIHELQFTTSPDGSSGYHGEVVDCAGGIVVGKFSGYRPRLILQDPLDPFGWGGIQVKDWIYPYDLFNQAQLGDWVALSNMRVEEYRGTTMLQRQTAYNPGHVIVSQGNPLPPLLIVHVAEIPAPIEGPPDEWYVEDHNAEPYESMRLTVRNVTVTQKDLGKAVDNYNLQNPQGENCWAADYMNEDVGPWGYHPFVEVGHHFCAVSGVFEQYTRLVDGWDYYQLVTSTTADLAICGDGDCDGELDLDDLPRFAECLGGPMCEQIEGGCDSPAWTMPPADLALQHCLMMDLDYDGDVDLGDFVELQVLFHVP